MELGPLSQVSGLSTKQKMTLRKGGLVSISDLMLKSPSDIAKKCRTPLSEIEGILDIVCKECAPQPRSLQLIAREGDEKFTSGDTALDQALGGGIRPGMLWEVVGESAAGKTQFALQLSLTVQLPRELGGLSGSACILTTSSVLPTNRLLEIAEAHPLLSQSLCSLSDVHTIKTPQIHTLLHVLSTVLPTFIDRVSASPDSKQVKFLVLDALTELFHTDQRTVASTLYERSRNLSEISTFLHKIANKYQIAVLVLSEVIDVFDRPPDDDFGQDNELIYRDQSRWFNRADGLPGESRKEASLGLVWANQVNARIMLSRTERTRHPDEFLERPSKRRRIDHTLQIQPQSNLVNETIRIRRLSIIFSSVSPPASLDYIVTAEGISTLIEDAPVSSASRTTSPHTEDTSSASARPAELVLEHFPDVSPLDVGFIVNESVYASGQELGTPDGIETRPSDEANVEDGPEQDEWEEYWKIAETQLDVYDSALSSSLNLQS